MSGNTNKTVLAVPTYFQAVRQLQDSYDYVLGIQHPKDWEHAKRGRPHWAVLPERGTYVNLHVLGAIGAGKTSQVCAPLLIQALKKYPDRPELRPSVFVLDLKGNMCASLFHVARALGRASDFHIIRPDRLLDPETQEPLIPAERYLGFDPLGVADGSDLQAIEFSDAIERTKERPPPDYFRAIQSEFLIHTFRLLRSGGSFDLADVRDFAASAEARNALVKNTADGGPPVVESQRWFREVFGKKSQQDQDGLLSGLSAVLTMVTNEGVLKTFCPLREGGKRPLGSFSDLLFERSSVVVFSCPPAQYGNGLSRLLALLTMGAFQRAMMKRTDAGYQGNTQRQVMMMVDEAHGFANTDWAEFLAVGRESRLFCVALTQSLAQYERRLGGAGSKEFLAGFRSRMVLSCDAHTAQQCERELGVVTERKQRLSISEGSSAGRRTRTRTRMFVDETRPRFTRDRLQQLPEQHAVLQLHDGAMEKPPAFIRTTPWYRLPFYLLDLREHPLIRCASGGVHEYHRGLLGRVKCSKCDKVLRPSEKSDYRTMKPWLRLIFSNPGSENRTPAGSGSSVSTSSAGPPASG
jgi:hypothetical protein